MKKSKNGGTRAAQKAVDAYNAGNGSFDALGSYTGKGRIGDVPCQDADDL